MTINEILTAARSRISDPDRWTQGAAARNRCGGKVPAMSPHATSWCALGAIDCAIGRRCNPELFLVAGALLDQQATHATIVLENDELGHDAVLAAFDRAIDRTGPLVAA